VIHLPSPSPRATATRPTSPSPRAGDSPFVAFVFSPPPYSTGDGGGGGGSGGGGGEDGGPSGAAMAALAVLAADAGLVGAALDPSSPGRRPARPWASRRRCWRRRRRGRSSGGGSAAAQRRSRSSVRRPRSSSGGWRRRGELFFKRGPFSPFVSFVRPRVVSWGGRERERRAPRGGDGYDTK
jgi:hypothetical protein